jgi:hypothetical protein
LGRFSKRFLGSLGAAVDAGVGRLWFPWPDQGIEKLSRPRSCRTSEPPNCSRKYRITATAAGSLRKMRAKPRRLKDRTTRIDIAFAFSPGLAKSTPTLGFETLPGWGRIHRIFRLNCRAMTAGSRVGNSQGRAGGSSNGLVMYWM